MSCCSSRNTPSHRSSKSHSNAIVNHFDECLKLGTCCFGELLNCDDIESKYGVLLGSGLNQRLTIQAKSVFEVSTTLEKYESVAWAIELLPSTCHALKRNELTVKCHWYDKGENSSIHQDEDAFVLDGWPKKLRTGECVSGSFTVDGKLDRAGFVISFDNRNSSIDKRFAKLSISHRGFHHGQSILTPYGAGTVSGWTDDAMFEIRLAYGSLYSPSIEEFKLFRNPPSFRFQHIHCPSNCPPTLNTVGINKLAGAFSWSEDAPGKCWASFTAREREIIDEAIGGSFEIGRVVDHHVHVIGSGQSGSGCFLTPKMTDPWNHPFGYVKLRAFMSASGITFFNSDQAYERRLLDLCRNIDPSGEGANKVVCLAFDKTYNQDGTENIDKTTLYIPNEYMFELCERNRGNCIPCCSVHPYRLDCERELERCFRKGARMVKWLPNSMLIDPMSNKCDRFYRKMKELGMVILSHAGEEHSVNSAAIQNEFGNPLRLRRALDFGVPVIAAHCASEGTSIDLDKLGSSSCCGLPPREENFLLLLRLFREEEYKSLLFADISAIVSLKRCKYVQPLLDAVDIHDRIVYGSDYPVPCLNFAISVAQLRLHGLVSKEQGRVLKKAYKLNPLLFDLLAKRFVNSPKTGNRFPDECFYKNPNLPELMVDQFELTV